MTDIYTPIMTTPDPDQIRDFTISAPPHRFRVDGDVFRAPGRLSPVALKKIAGLHASLGDMGSLSNDVGRAIEIVGDLFEVLLPGESGTRFKARLNSEEEAIDLNQQAIPILYWLLEQYGLRPTEPSSPSPVGSTDGQMDTPNGGISSTDGVWPAVAIIGGSTSPTG